MPSSLKVLRRCISVQFASGSDMCGDETGYTIVRGSTIENNRYVFTGRIASSPFSSMSLAGKITRSGANDILLVLARRC